MRTLLPLVLVATAAAVLGAALWVMSDLPREAPIQLMTPPGTTAPAADFFKERLELYDRRARDLQWLLGALLAAGALYTLLQGVFAYLSVQNFNATTEAVLKKATDRVEELKGQVDTARSSLETDARTAIGELRRRLEKQSASTLDEAAAATARIETTRTALEAGAKSRIEELGRDLERQFPVAGRMEESLNHALRLLDGYFQDADWYEKLYENLRPDQRQEILFYENVIAAFAAMSLPRLDEPLARAFRGLGSFYTSKYKKDRIPDHLDRARFYFHRALQRRPGDFASMNMLGYIALGCVEPPAWNEAEQHFRSSLGACGNQQRAQYNLADIAYRRDRNLEVALKFYREALAENRWEHRRNLENEVYIRFNLACVLARIWERDKAAAAAEESIQLLERSVNDGPQYVAGYLISETAGDGDLVPLLSDTQYAARVQALRASN